MDQAGSCVGAGQTPRPHIVPCWDALRERSPWCFSAYGSLRSRSLATGRRCWGPFLQRRVALPAPNPTPAVIGNFET